MNLDPDTQQLQSDIFRRKSMRAGTLTFEERFRAGADLYDDAMRWMRLMIESENPCWSVDEVEQEIERRKKIAKRIDHAGVYQPGEPDNG